MSSKGVARSVLGCLLLLLFVFAGCDEGSAPEPGEVEVEDVRLIDTDEEGPVLEGRFINFTDEPISVAIVRVSIYDSENQTVGESLVEVREIEANSEKEFSSVVELEGDIHRAQVQSIMVQ